MPNRKAAATWEGSLQQGKGRMKLGSGAYEGPFSFQTRMGDEPGTNPEELIGAALSGCFSMALSHGLGQASITPTLIRTDATVHFEAKDGGFTITRIDLKTEVSASGLEDAAFQKIALETKAQCPVSKALAGTEITLAASLV